MSLIKRTVTFDTPKLLKDLIEVSECNLERFRYQQLEYLMSVFEIAPVLNLGRQSGTTAAIKDRIIKDEGLSTNVVIVPNHGTKAMYLNDSPRIPPHAIVCNINQKHDELRGIRSLRLFYDACKYQDIVRHYHEVMAPYHDRLKSIVIAGVH